MVTDYCSRRTTPEKKKHYNIYIKKLFVKRHNLYTALCSVCLLVGLGFSRVTASKCEHFLLQQEPVAPSFGVLLQCP